MDLSRGRGEFFVMNAAVVAGESDKAERGLAAPGLVEVLPT